MKCLIDFRPLIESNYFIEKKHHSIINNFFIPFRKKSNNFSFSPHLCHLTHANSLKHLKVKYNTEYLSKGI